MNLFALPFRNAIANGRRTFLTALSIGVSVALVIILKTLLLEITNPSALEDAPPRMVVRHRTSLTMSLPRPYGEKLRAVEGVAAVSVMNWYGGVWRDTDFKNMFARFAVEPEHWFKVFNDFKAPPEQFEAFLAARSGAMIGEKLVERYGFKAGDRLIIKGDIYPVDLELTISGIFTGKNADFLVFHQKYLDELMGETQRAGTFFLLANDRKQVSELLPRIEAVFRNSDSQVKVETEKEFAMSFMEMLGNIQLLINSIVSVIVFAILIISASTMAMAVRERTREIATLKAIGYTRGLVLGLVVSEGMIVSLLGGGLGLVCAWLFLPSPRWFFSFTLALIAGCLVAVVLWVITAMLPDVPGNSRLRFRLCSIRETLLANAAWMSTMSGLIMGLILLHVIPPMDWFAVTGGMFPSMAARPETIRLGLGIVLGVGLTGSVFPAWNAARMPVLDGLRTLG